ncbi:uncharacterized protein LOC135103382 [Scylla paramamosain]|uniref:uncharacterized protein LOC135103382 n=1 Tax=Scylla paramamosain TaxID=85552 RepID=UPI0030827118
MRGSLTGAPFRGQPMEGRGGGALPRRHVWVDGPRGKQANSRPFHVKRSERLDNYHLDLHHVSQPHPSWKHRHGNSSLQNRYSNHQVKEECNWFHATWCRSSWGCLLLQYNWFRATWCRSSWACLLQYTYSATGFMQPYFSSLLATEKKAVTGRGQPVPGASPAILVGSSTILL